MLEETNRRHQPLPPPSATGGVPSASWHPFLRDSNFCGGMPQNVRPARRSLGLVWCIPAREILCPVSATPAATYGSRSSQPWTKQWDGSAARHSLRRTHPGSFPGTSVSDPAGCAHGEDARRTGDRHSAGGVASGAVSRCAPVGMALAVSACCSHRYAGDTPGSGCPHLKESGSSRNSGCLCLPSRLASQCRMNIRR